jgi:protein SCO1
MAAMNSQTRRFPLTIGIGLLLFTLTVALVFLLAGLGSGAAHKHSLPVYGQVSDFALTNQDGAVTTLANLRGHPWVADVIFTRCAGPCPIMTRQMKSLQDALPETSGARLVTLTTDPDYDTPPVLKRYAERFGANPRRWTFLTGPKPGIAALATGSLKLGSTPVSAGDRQSAADLFVHSTIFVVVDKHAQLRGVYQTAGEGVDWPSNKNKILVALAQLEREK